MLGVVRWLTTLATVVVAIWIALALLPLVLVPHGAFGLRPSEGLILLLLAMLLGVPAVVALYIVRWALGRGTSTKP